MERNKRFSRGAMGTGWSILVLNPGIRRDTERIKGDSYVIFLRNAVLDALFRFQEGAAKCFLSMAKEEGLTMERNEGFVLIADEESRIDLFLSRFCSVVNEDPKAR